MIRPETVADHEAIRQVNRLAFGQDAEARLVDALRDGGFVRVSLVAEVEGQVVGHILFSDLPIMAGTAIIPALALAPMAVLPRFQRQRIGTALVQRGLEVCRQDGHQIVVVLGHSCLPTVRILGYSCPTAGVTVFRRGFGVGAGGVAGTVVYPPPFGAFGANEEIEWEPK